ncbi:DinB family protein [Tsukamurella paurometabola]|uniref:DinB family protein n=1 Tax=Tsukamurella paurometabola (strain ATCC 8368 / DSM 20162 / CCUG 35730 / CIP 100753 / JCM 10117 / KCTC 9821 / NBRC 16120 / NCIMB 702349 / NCTC 13040) TaxID=521096 RepID=D5USY8_TSUPD|nr:DinB family protein [Tsukamurella paurometabola]ADG77275.1 protein of unknown function DUF664 [Tsukamurella paurometabola DSM 20162]SUP43355.1 Protein of uncharacterised function (DUF664) [Tsukamurella paurometabola]
MPFLAPAAPTERDGLRGFIAQQLDGLRHTSYGLTEEQIRLSPARSALTIGGLLKHVTVSVGGWVEKIEAAPGEPPLDVEAQQAAYGSDFVVNDGDTLESILAAYDAVAGRALAAAESADLDGFVPTPKAPWFPPDLDGWTVRWVLLHIIEEVGRHAGHADIIREQIDGATMYELVAGAEGMGDLGFVQPWTPPSE